MPRPGTGPSEKPNNFGKAMKRLFKGLRKWRIFLGIALVLAGLSSIFALISPNKLSEITDAITAGITPNQSKLVEVAQEIGKNIQTGRPLEIDGETISVADQARALQVLAGIREDEPESTIQAFNELPESVYNLVKPRMDLELIKSIALFLAILYIVSAILGYIQNFILSTISNRFAESLRTRIARKINRLPLRYFDSHEMGDVLSRATNDVDLINQHLNTSLGYMVSSTTQLVGSVIMMFYTNGIMAVTAIAASLIGIVLMVMILSKSQKYFNEKQVQLGKLNGHIEETYSGHLVVKAYNGEDEAREEFGKLNRALYNSNQKSQFLSGLMPSLMAFIGNFGYVAVCVVGAALVINGQITFGVIVAFMLYVRLFTSPLSQIAQAMSGLQSSAAASERVYEFLDEPEMEKETNVHRHLDPETAKGRIEFRNVKFSYDPSTPIIKDFSIKVQSGQKVAIVGPTGAGKTTLVNLLMRFYEINSGEILIDGISTKELSRKNVHDLFTMVLQDTWLFSGTVRENIKFNRPDVNDDEVWRALEAVGVDHFVKTLPGGLDAVIDDSDAISQGQKQLLTIARGMIEDAPFLILDEATSNVDARTEEIVQRAMDKLMKNRTSFIIAHRLSTIRNADIILVMREGDIVERGTHDELMARGGFYAELYNSQFSR